VELFWSESSGTSTLRRGPANTVCVGVGDAAARERRSCGVVLGDFKPQELANTGDAGRAARHRARRSWRRASRKELMQVSQARTCSCWSWGPS